MSFDGTVKIIHAFCYRDEIIPSNRNKLRATHGSYNAYKTTQILQNISEEVYIKIKAKILVIEEGVVFVGQSKVKF